MQATAFSSTIGVSGHRSLTTLSLLETKQLGVVIVKEPAEASSKF